MNQNENTLAIVGLIVAIILLLLFRRKSDVFVTDQKLGDLKISPNVSTYNIDPLSIKDFPPFRSGNWDWMQTTNLGCRCDDFVSQQVFMPAPPEPRRVIPVYISVAQPAPVIALPFITPAPLPAPTYNYPPYVPPVFTYKKRSFGIFYMSYTDGTGKVYQNNKIPLFVIETSDGELLNAYKRKFTSGRAGSIIYGATTYYPETSGDRV